MNTMLVIILLIVNTVVSVILTRVWCKGKLVGWLRIDRSVPDEEPYLYAELRKGVGDITKLKYATFEVLNESYLPPE